MEFADKESEILFRQLMGDTELVENLEEIVERYNLKKNDYLTKMMGFKRAMRTKHAWRKFRHVYKFGMNRFHRRNSTKKLRKRLYDLVMAGTRIKKDEGIAIVWGQYDQFEALKWLNGIKALVAKEGTYFDMEEDYLESADWSETVLLSLVKLEASILEGKCVAEEDLEMVFCLIGDEFMKEGKLVPTDEEVGYTDCYIVAVPERNKTNDNP